MAGIVACSMHGGRDLHEAVHAGQVSDSRQCSIDVTATASTEYAPFIVCVVNLSVENSSHV